MTTRRKKAFVHGALRTSAVLLALSCSGVADLGGRNAVPGAGGSSLASGSSGGTSTGDSGSGGSAGAVPIGTGGAGVTGGSGGTLAGSGGTLAGSGGRGGAFVDAGASGGAIVTSGGGAGTLASSGGTAGRAGSGGALVSGDGGPPSCNDNLEDGDETAIDCGGSCSPCGRDEGCIVDADCSPTEPGCDVALGGCKCDAVTSTCDPNHCVDGRKDYGESDVDCGGDCAGCGPDKTCNTDQDCALVAPGCDTYGCACDALSLKCVFNRCPDHKQDGNETEIDCGGGPPCNGCALGQRCVGDYDCASQACDFVSFECVAESCTDHHEDGDETDADCGGTTCGRLCDSGMRCTTGADCASGTCLRGRPPFCE